MKAACPVTKSAKKPSGSASASQVSAGCSVRVVCSALDSAPCVVLATDNQRILFDAGEGVQRMCVEQKVRLSKTDRICFTQISAHTVAGSPGLALTCADSGCRQLQLLGPPGLASFWASTSAFTHRPQHQVQVQEVTSRNILDSGEVVIEAVPLLPATTSATSANTSSRVDFPGEDQMESQSASASLPPQPTHICYVCQTKSLPGRFDFQKAKAMGVPVGPLFATLKAGGDVTVPLPGGGGERLVRSVDVMGASEAPRFVAIICDVASRSPLAYGSTATASEVRGGEEEGNSLLQMLVSDPYWTRFAPGGDRYGQLECLVHYSGADVTSSAPYREWAKQFNYQFDPASLVDPVKANKRGKRGSIGATASVVTGMPAAEGEETSSSVMRPMHVLVGKDNAGQQSAFLASTIYTRKLHMLFPTVFTPLSVLQRREVNEVSADDVLDVQATLRIDSVESLNNLNDTDATSNNYVAPDYDDMDLDDDELMALGPPPLVRNPNTTLLAAMARENEEAAAAALASKNVSGKRDSGSAPEQKTLLNEAAGVPGMIYTLLPKSSRGLDPALSDEAALVAVQQEVDTLWTRQQHLGEEGEGDTLRQNILRCLQESSSARNNVLALQRSNFLFVQEEESQDVLCDDIDGYSNKSPLQLSRKSPAKTPEKVLISENVNDSSTSVRQDCLLLGVPECAISFLGTGCAIPSKYRNVSGILLQLSAQSSMLLDCGEGTWQQLVRMAREHPGMCRSLTSTSGFNSRANQSNVSPMLARKWLAKTIKVVWISHPHADHHLGLMTLVAERKRHWLSDADTAATAAASSSAVAEDFVPLLIIAPPSVLSFLHTCTASDSLMRSSYIGIDNHAFEPEWAKSLNNTKRRRVGYASSCQISRSDSDIAGDVIMSGRVSAETTDSRTDQPNKKEWRNDVLRPVDQQLLSDIGIYSLENVQVHHCSQSFGLRVQSSQGWSLVYSGDTRPCPQLVRLGQGATILIHEATFDDTKPEEAIKKRHSTISEAIHVAKEMNAHRLILTHFSQRYPGMPPLPEDYSALPCGLLLAFDFMHVQFSDLLWTHTMNPALMLAFPPESAITDDEQDLNDEQDSNDSSRKNSTEEDSKKRGISQQPNALVSHKKKLKST